MTRGGRKPTEGRFDLRSANRRQLPAALSTRQLREGTPGSHGRSASPDQKSHFHGDIIFEQRRQTHGVAAGRIGHLNLYRRRRKAAGVTRVPEVVEHSLTEHGLRLRYSQEYR